MNYRPSWDRERVRQVFTTESRQKARELFLRTHRPFQRIRVDFCKDDGAPGAFVSEDQVRAVVQAGTLHADNRLFFVAGEAGSGKSELCQWLEYTVDERVSLPIHIPRSMTTAAHVVALLRQKLDAAAPARVLQHVPLSTQADYVTLSAVVLLYEQGNPALTPVDAWARLIGGAETRQLIADYLTVVAHGGFAPLPFTDAAPVQELYQRYAIAVAPTNLALVAGELRRVVARALEQSLWLGDVRSLLADISERVVRQGRRPLLLLEDITAFQVLGDRLLDYLLDLTSGHFDAVIGVTTGFERTQLAGATLAGDLTHIHHRLRARFVLTDDHGRSYGLEDDLIELAQVYLAAARTTTPAFQPVSDGFSDGLYPFTETALRRAFACLHEEGNPRQTPRLFLEHVLAAALLSDAPPPVTFDYSTYLTPPPTLFRSDEAPDPRLHSLLRWYGELGDDAITLDARIARQLGISLPPEMQSAGVIRVSRAYIAQSPDSVTRSDWQQELRELQTWLSVGGLYPNRETLKRGIERVLLNLGDPRVLGNPASTALAGAHIAYARGDERLPIYLGRESGDQPSTPTYVKVQVSGTPAERGILEEFAYLALSDAEVSQVCRNVALTLDWAQRHWDAYNTDVRALLSSRMEGVTVEQLIWAAWRLMGHLVGMPWEERPRLNGYSVSAEPYAQVSPWSSQRHAACYSAGEALLAQHETVRRLFIGAFTLRDTLLDRERCVEVQRDAATATTVQRLARVNVSAVKTLPYKIRPLGLSLADLLVPLQRYAQALVQLDCQAALDADLDDLTRKETHLAAQQRLDHAMFQRQLLTLRWRGGEVGVTWNDTWTAAFEYLAALTGEQLAELYANLRRVRAATEAIATADGLDHWAYQQARHTLRPIIQHPYWAAVDTLQDIQTETLTMARARYQRGGGLITGTTPYRSLLRMTRAVWKELADG